MPDENARWYCARSKPGQDQIAIENLERQLFTVYYPYEEVRRRRRGRIVNSRHPIFPSYILINMALEDAHWRAINSTRGIAALISFSPEGRPTPLRSGEVERLQERDKAGELHVTENSRIENGSRVRFKYGWNVDKIGTVLRTRKERVELLLNLLGRETRVIAPMHALEAV